MLCHAGEFVLAAGHFTGTGQVPGTGLEKTGCAPASSQRITTVHRRLRFDTIRAWSIKSHGNQSANEKMFGL
jgi:hypothetical protein